LWRENVWISRGCDIPGGIFSEEEDNVMALDYSISTVSKVFHLSFLDTIQYD
jgi:hypothetical protein